MVDERDREPFIVALHPVPIVELRRLDLDVTDPDDLAEVRPETLRTDRQMRCVERHLDQAHVKRYVCWCLPDPVVYRYRNTESCEPVAHMWKLTRRLRPRSRRSNGAGGGSLLSRSSSGRPPQRRLGVARSGPHDPGTAGRRRR